jgi:hypothetical protein
MESYLCSFRPQYRHLAYLTFTIQKKLIKADELQLIQKLLFNTQRT